MRFTIDYMLVTDNNIKNIIKNSPDRIIDARLDICNVRSTKTLEPLELYYNYLELMLEIIRRDYLSADNKFLLNFDLGYIPYLTPPKELADQLYSMLATKIRKLSNVSFSIQDPKTLQGSHLDNTTKDIWLSRLDVARYFNVNIDQVSIRSIIEEVLK